MIIDIMDTLVGGQDSYPHFVALRTVFALFSLTKIKNIDKTRYSISSDFDFMIFSVCKNFSFLGNQPEITLPIFVEH